MKKSTLLILFVLVSNSIYSQCAQSFAAGEWSNFAIKSDGMLSAWGQKSISPSSYSNYIGSTLPVNIGTDTNWSSVSVGFDFMVAKKNNGTIWGSKLSCIGGIVYIGYPIDYNNIGVTYQIGTDSDWDKIYVGGHHTLALKTNGTLWSWGYSQYGELGQTSGSSLPAQIGTDNNWQKIYAGVAHSLAIKTDGSLWAWGNGQCGQLGDWNEVNRSTPVYVGTTSDWTVATAGNNCSYGIKNNGTLWAWGANAGGQLGTGNPIFGNRNTPVQVDTDNNWSNIVSYSNAVGISESESFTVALKTDGTIWKRVGNSFVQFGTENNWQNIDIGVNHVIASKTDGSIWTWGMNYAGQLGVANINETNIPQLVECSTWIILATADFENPTPKASYIYPNPTKDEFTFASINEEGNYQIINSIGQVIQSGNAINNTKVNVKNLSNGVYYIKINQKTIKLIKE